MKEPVNPTPLEICLSGLGGEKRINYTLERFKNALDHVGNPHHDVHSLVIAGTNGKGTTTLLVSAALARAGLSVATFLSPHLQCVNERILHNLEPIEEDELTELALELEPVAKRFDLTYFEFLTFLFFIRARRRMPDLVVLEVGLGGRLDATNVTDPIACAITNIDFDHQEYLGETLEAILEEKMGVLRPETLLFTGVRDPHLLDRLERRCLDLDAIYYFTRELSIQPATTSWSGQSFTLNGFPFEVSSPSVGAIENAALAFLLLRITFPRIPVSVLQEAFRAVATPGRMEVVSESPRVVLSGDHNPAGIECLKKSLKKIGAGSIRVLCAFSPDKPYRRMYEELAGISEEILLTQVTRLKDKMPPDYPHLGRFEPDPRRALDEMLSRLGPDETLLITGSLYLVGELRPVWRPKVSFWRDAHTAPPR